MSEEKRKIVDKINLQLFELTNNILTKYPAIHNDNAHNFINNSPQIDRIHNDKILEKKYSLITNKI